MSDEYETGSTLFEDFDGTFTACHDRVKICGYACCDHSKLGNMIFAGPGEIEDAKRKNLSFEHLRISEQGNGHCVQCTRPCVEGEFKSIDCSIYPLYPASSDGVLWTVSDRRKCPIPIHELTSHALRCRRVVLQQEKEYPGMLSAMVEAGKELTGHYLFPYFVLSHDVIRISHEQYKELAGVFSRPPMKEGTETPYNLPFEYKKLYGPLQTPEDGDLMFSLSELLQKCAAETQNTNGSKND